MRLAPGVFVRSDVLGFTEIRRIGILRWIEVAGGDCDPVRCASVTVAGVIVSARWEGAGKRIDPRAGADAVLTRIQA